MCTEHEQVRKELWGRNRIRIVQWLGHMMVRHGDFFTKRRLACISIALDEETDKYCIYRGFLIK